MKVHVTSYPSLRGIEWVIATDVVDTVNGGCMICSGSGKSEKLAWEAFQRAWKELPKEKREMFALKPTHKIVDWVPDLR